MDIWPVQIGARNHEKCKMRGKKNRGFTVYTWGCPVIAFNVRAFKMDALVGRSEEAYFSTASWSLEWAARIKNIGRFGAKFAKAVLPISVHIKFSPVRAECALSVTSLCYGPVAARQERQTANAAGASMCTRVAGMQNIAQLVCLCDILRFMEINS
jgi:hypothetical protein